MRPKMGIERCLPGSTKKWSLRLYPGWVGLPPPQVDGDPRFVRLHLTSSTRFGTLSSKTSDAPRNRFPVIKGCRIDWKWLSVSGQSATIIIYWIYHNQYQQYGSTNHSDSHSNTPQHSILHQSNSMNHSDVSITTTQLPDFYCIPFSTIHQQIITYLAEKGKFAPNNRLERNHLW